MNALQNIRYKLIEWLARDDTIVLNAKIIMKYDTPMIQPRFTKSGIAKRNYIKGDRKENFDIDDI